MKQKNIGLALLIIAASLIFYSYRMSVTIDDGDYVNLHLLSNRQNILIFGCFIFLVGVVFFIFPKRNNNETQDENYHLYLMSKFGLFYSASKIFSNKVTHYLVSMWRAFIANFSFIDDGLSLILQKISVGLIFGFIAGHNLEFLVTHSLYRTSYAFPWLYDYNLPDIAFYTFLLFVLIISAAKGSLKNALKRIVPLCLLLIAIGGLIWKYIFQDEFRLWMIFLPFG